MQDGDALTALSTLSLALALLGRLRGGGRARLTQPVDQFVIFK
jgi:hypothetical protein